METSELLSLWPLVAATLTPMAGFVLALVGFMHRDLIKIRDVIGHSDKENRESLERSNKENRELLERSNKENRESLERSNKENRELLERSNKENRELMERSNKAMSEEFAEHKRVTEENHRATQQQLGKINDSLADARERLARIEGHLSSSPERFELRQPPLEAEPDG